MDETTTIMIHGVAVTAAAMTYLLEELATFDEIREHE
jgi:hypothetical protein